MGKVSNWDKFVLLLWKNWILLWNQKIQLVMELLLPAVFSLLLVLVRSLVDAKFMDCQLFKSQAINNLQLFNHSRLPDSLDFTLLYSPTNPYLDNIVAHAAHSLELKGYGSYANASALQTALTLKNYIAGVQFDDDLADIDNYPEKLTYALRFPSELRTKKFSIGLTWETNRLFPLSELPGPRNPSDQDGGVPVGYLREGFLPIQNALSTAFLQLAGNISSLPNIVLQRYPYPDYISDPLLQVLESIMSMIILLCFIYPCTYTTQYITAEKEKQLKEVMKIMGLQNWIHWSAWFVKSFIMLAISSIFIVVLTKIKWVDNVAVLTHSDWSVILFLLLIYTISSICFSFMLASIFSKASIAAAVTGLIWFIAYLPFTFVLNNYDELSLGDKLGWCLISNTAMGFGFKIVLGFEGTGEGLQWSNLFTPVSVDDDLTVGAVIVMMLVSSIIYMLICLYVEQIFPGDFGVPKKWYFPFTANFWCGDVEYIGIEDSAIEKNEIQKPDAFEAGPIGKYAGIQVKNLKKKFGDKTAVRGLSLNMYEDEITVLLGHNGAGKTTTISMLTGMFPPSAGTAIVNDSDIRTNIEGARMSMGICPQHNVLFDYLTVANHLIFFSRLKGLKGDAIVAEMNKYLKMIELENKANVASSKLSGGMKRKLSVCCALVGNTKVVLCDEPTSGMDPSARRQLWDLLQSEKNGRTILLTTHFMDEADVLGDRIAIMCDGELKCHGTSFFLKKRYGSGYRLICVKQEGCNAAEVTALLNQHIPDIKPESDIGAELSYLLPENYSPEFEKMFRSLEENSQDLALSGYGISIASLEEVFMQVGAETSKENGRTLNGTNVTNGTNGVTAGGDDVESMNSDSLFSENVRLLKGLGLYRNQWVAMFEKKYLYSFRNKLLFFIQNIMPVFLIVTTILIARSKGISQKLDPMLISLTQYPQTVSVLETAANVLPGSLEANVSASYKDIIHSFGDSHEFQTTGNESFTKYILDLGETIQVRINSRYLSAATIANGQITAWLNNRPYHTAPLTLNLVHNALAKQLIGANAEINVINSPLPFTAQGALIQINRGNALGTQLAMNICLCMCLISGFYILFLIKERVSRSKLLQFVGGVKVWTYWLTQFIWDYVTYTFTALIVVCTIACFQEDGFSSVQDLARYFAVLMCFGLSMLPFTYLVAFFSTEPATGFTRITLINYLAGMAMFLVILVMSLKYSDTKNTQRIQLLQWFFRIFPHFSLAQGLNKLYINVATRDACNKDIINILPDALRCQLVPRCCSTIDYFAWKEPGILPEMVYMAATALIFFLLLIVQEYQFFNVLINYVQKRTTKPPPPIEDGYLDEDVQRERNRILNMPTGELMSENLVLDRVTKYYNKFLAVNQLSLCVKQSECFGLLGVNGAGKTSTFKMMVGDERITWGSAYVKGNNLESDLNSVYKEIGYCPQFDALLDDLTGRETLRIFCMLRGVHKKCIRQVSEDLATSFGFMKHIDKETKAYSGGNKRKLSSALAVIGNPSVIYLDEPTTGMDPVARRQLWNVLCRIRDSGKSIVLTSHNMEECEALCTRLAIMVNGEFKCMGSPQHLKNKFSKGLILKIKVKRLSSVGAILELQQNIERVKEFVEREFEQAILQEEYQGILTFYIPLDSIKWSKIFGLMETNREELNVEDYTISQTTLEEIFLEFAKSQRADARELQ